MLEDVFAGSHDLLKLGRILVLEGADVVVDAGSALSYPLAIALTTDDMHIQTASREGPSRASSCGRQQKLTPAALPPQ